MKYDLQNLKNIYINIFNQANKLDENEKKIIDLHDKFTNAVEKRDNSLTKTIVKSTCFLTYVVCYLMSLVGFIYSPQILFFLLMVIFTSISMFNLKNILECISDFSDNNKIVLESQIQSELFFKEHDNIKSKLNYFIKEYNDFKVNYNEDFKSNKLISSMNYQSELVKLVEMLDLSNETINNLTIDNYLLDDSFHINTEVPEYNDEVSSYQKVRSNDKYGI